MRLRKKTKYSQEQSMSCASELMDYINCIPFIKSNKSSNLSVSNINGPALLYVANGLAKARRISGGNMNNLYLHLKRKALLILKSFSFQCQCPAHDPCPCGDTSLQHHDRQQGSKPTAGSSWSYEIVATMQYGGGLGCSLERRRSRVISWHKEDKNTSIKYWSKYTFIQKELINFVLQTFIQNWRDFCI